MDIYKISYANFGDEARITFEDTSNHPLSHYEVVTRAARHKIPDAIPTTIKDPFRRRDTPSTSAQIMAWAAIENVEFCIGTKPYIHRVESK